MIPPLQVTAGHRPESGEYPPAGYPPAECPPAEPRRGALVAAALLAAVLVAATILGELPAQPAAWVLAADIGAGVLGCAAILLVPRWPVPTSAFLVLLAALSPAATPPVAAATLGTAMRRGMRVGAVVATVSALAQILRALWRPSAGLPLGWWVVIVVVAQAALLGWAATVNARRALIASLHERARRAEAEQASRVAEARLLERTRIAGEMHDVLAHRLSLLSTYAGALEYRPDAPAEQLTKAVSVIRDSAHQALEELREVIGVLRYEPDGGDGAPQPTLADVRGLVEESRDAGMRVELRESLTGTEPVPPGVGRTAYRIVQEGLTNARKHAPGLPVTVRLDGIPDGRLDVEIGNPLATAARGPAVPGSGTGLVGLAERVALAGGELHHGATADGTWRLVARLPWPR